VETLFQNLLPREKFPRNYSRQISREIFPQNTREQATGMYKRRAKGAKMDDHCKLKKGEIFQDFDCLLNFVDGKSDKFYRIQLLKNDEGFHVWTRWGRNVSVFDISYCIK
jgi:hypothetical protein